MSVPPYMPGSFMWVLGIELHFSMLARQALQQLSCLPSSTHASFNGTEHWHLICFLRGAVEGPKVTQKISSAFPSCWLETVKFIFLIGENQNQQVKENHSGSAEGSLC